MWRALPLLLLSTLAYSASFVPVTDVPAEARSYTMPAGTSGCFAMTATARCESSEAAQTSAPSNQVCRDPLAWLEWQQPAECEDGSPIAEIERFTIYRVLEGELRTPAAPVVSLEVAGLPPPAGGGEMAFPSIRSSAFTADTSAEDAHPVDLPASVQAGDLLIVFSFSGHQDVWTWDNTTAGSWTMLWHVDGWNGDAGGGIQFFAHYKWADGTEGGKTLTLGGLSSRVYAHRAFAIQGTHATSPPEYALTIHGSVNSGSPPALNPTGWDVEDTLWIAVAGVDVTTITGFPSGYSDTGQTSSSGSSRLGTVGTAFLESAAASQDPGTFSFGATQTAVTVTVAIRPADGGGGDDDVDVEASVVDIAAATHAATVARETDVAASLANLAMVANGATTALSTAIAAEAAQMDLMTLGATLELSVAVEAALAAIEQTGHAAALGLGQTIAASLAPLAVAAQPASLALSTAITAAVQQMLLAEQAAVVTTDGSVVIQATIEALEVGTLSAALALDREIAAALESLTISEDAALVGLSRAVLATQARLEVSEQAAAVAVLGAFLDAALVQLRLGTFDAEIAAGVPEVTRALAGVYLTRGAGRNHVSRMGKAFAQTRRGTGKRTI